ncbi:MAG: hypothetical protein AAGA36_00295 [Pseudomonadota bacterium]
MATTRAIVIGTGGDYASVSAFKADLSNLPSDLVAADEIWQVQFVNKGTEWDLGGGMGLEGLTTDDTHFVILEPQPGGSFLDLFGPTTPFRYHPDGLGVALDCNRDFNNNGLGLPGTSLVRRLMIRNSRFRGGIASDVFMEDCITWVRAQDAHNNVRATRVLAFQEETNDRHGFSLDGTETVDRYNDGVLYIQLGNGHQGVTQIRGGRVINSAYFAGTGDDVVSNAINTGNGFGEIDYSAMGDAAISGAGFDSVGPNMLYNVDITTAIENFSSDMTLMDARLSASSPLRGAGEGGIDLGPGWTFGSAPQQASVAGVAAAPVVVASAGQILVGAAQSVAASAVAALAAQQTAGGTLTKDFTVLRGSGVILAGQTSLTLQEGVDFTLEPGIASTAWFAFISNTHFTGMGSTTGGQANANNFTVSLSYAGNDVVFTRDGNTGTCRVDWQILQYVGPVGGVNEIQVRDKASFGHSTDIVNRALPGSVIDTSKVVPWITGQRDNTGSRDTVNRALHTAIISGGSIQFRRGNPGGTATVSYAVVELTGSAWAVDSYEFSSASQNYSVAITSIGDLAEAFLQCHFRYETTSNAGLDDCSVRVHLEAVDSLRVTATTGVDANLKTHVVWVMSNPNISVDRVLGEMAGVGNEEVDDVAVPQVAQLDEAFTMLSNNSTGGGNFFPRGFVNHLLLDDSTVRLRQSDDGQTSEFALEVVQLPRSVSAGANEISVAAAALAPESDASGSQGIFANAAVLANDTIAAMAALQRQSADLAVGASPPVANVTAGQSIAALIGAQGVSGLASLSGLQRQPLAVDVDAATPIASAASQSTSGGVLVAAAQIALASLAGSQSLAASIEVTAAVAVGQAAGLQRVSAAVAATADLAAASASALSASGAFVAVLAEDPVGNASGLLRQAAGAAAVNPAPTVVMLGGLSQAGDTLAIAADADAGVLGRQTITAAIVAEVSTPMAAGLAFTASGAFIFVQTSIPAVLASAGLSQSGAVATNSVGPIVVGLANSILQLSVVTAAPVSASSSTGRVLQRLGVDALAEAPQVDIFSLSVGLASISTIGPEGVTVASGRQFQPATLAALSAIAEAAGAALQRQLLTVVSASPPSFASLTAALRFSGEVTAVATTPIVLASELADFAPIVEVDRSVVLVEAPREISLAPASREVLLIGGLRELTLTSR